MGMVIAFPGPKLQARRRQHGGFCEITVFPGRQVDERDARLLTAGFETPPAAHDDKPVQPKRKRT